MCNCKCKSPSNDLDKYMVPQRMVYYVDIGQLPKTQAVAYIKEVAEEWLKNLPEIERSRWLFVPVRDGSTRIERI